MANSSCCSATNQAKPASNLASSLDRMDAPARRAVNPSTLQRTAESLLREPQHAHLFVEGCTCGSGVIGCCPCTLGLSSAGSASQAVQHGHPGPTAHHSQHTHLSPAIPAPISGMLGSVGMYLGARAWLTNRAASARLQQAHHYNEVQRGHTQAQLALLSTTTAAPQPERQAAMRLRTEEAQQGQLGRVLAASRTERAFDAAVPGALQLFGSGLMLLQALPQHTWAPALGVYARLVAPTTSLVWSSYGALSAARCATRAFGAWQRMAACTPGAAPSDAAAALCTQARKQAKQQLLWQASGAVAWSIFAAGSMVQMAAQAGMLAHSAPLLGCILLAGAAATGVSLFAPASVHTVATPHLLVPQLSAPQTGEGLRGRLLQTIDAQHAAQNAFVTGALQGRGLRGFAQRLQHVLEPWRAPQCGPRAFATLAQAAPSAAADGPLGRRALATFAATLLQHEQAWLQSCVDAAAPGADEKQSPSCCRAPPDASVEDAAAKDAQDGVAAAENGGETAIDGLRQTSIVHALQRQEHQSLARRNKAESMALLQQEWNAFAQDPTCGKRYASLRISTLMAFGLLGELAQPLQARNPQWFVQDPQATPLAFAYNSLNPSAAADFAAALAPTLDGAFVRLFVNPHRLAAERDALLYMHADAAQHPQPQPVAQAASCCA